MERETYFSVEQRHHSYPPGYEAHYWHIAKHRFVDRLLRGLERAPLLDVGCGMGTYVRHLRAAGYEAFGVERRLPAPAGFLFDGDLADVPREVAGAIGTVLLSDVIEHVEDERALLARCVEHLPALRHIVITVPARPELWSNYDRYYGHFRRYTLQSLRRAVSGGRISVLRSGYFFHLLYLPAWLLARSSGREIAIDAPAKAAAPFHRLLGGLLTLESRWLPAALPGTSAFAVCTVQGR
jgi:SAM-dependent methyltransferase